ncbi:MAG: hypothetical protein ACRD1F_01655, partial [Terriglobales bacterium]
GGYVRYVWGVTYGEAEGGQFASSDGSCLDRYGEPAITARYVSLDGATEALEQSFEYATTWPAGGATWTGKTTTVTNHDQVRGTSFVTAYAYAGYTVPFQPNDDTSSTLQLPVEATITAKDWNGATLRTTTETWNNPRELATKTVAESNGEVDERAYSYDANEQQTENDEYGYGSGAPGALARVTLHAYGCAPGVHVVDRPTLVEIESGSRVRTAETDYAYDQSALTASGASDGRDPAYAAGGGITARCNLTTLTKYNYTGDIAETFTYDDAGNRLTHTDGNGNTTSFSYSPSLQAAYLTGITLPDTSTGGKTIEHSLTMAYDSASGQVISRTDVQNATTTSYTYDDPLDRLTEQNNPDGGKITYAYTANSLETKKLLTASYWTDQFNHWDGLGNADRSLTWNGTTWDTTDTAFDGEQLPLYVSYPYASSGMNSTKATSNAADPGATTAFDALGRPTEVAHSDGAAITISWSGPDRTITDAAGRAREEYYNALAQLAEVKEFTDSKGDGYATYYGYGSLDDLKTVTQGSETRTFDYDNLNRLMDATNPESGTVDYQYDNDGNLIEQTDANGTVVHYGYDALNRLRTRSYTVSGSTAATHAVEIDYDTDSTGAGTDYAYGRMTRVISGATSIGMDQYGPMGRLETYATTAGGNTYTTSMRFDDLGDPVWEKLPDGRSIGMSTGYEGRASLLKDDSAGYDYLHYRTYSPAGALAEEEFGNGLVEDVAYNSRLQPIGITVKDPNDQSDNTWKMNLAIAYTKTGVQTADNGNVVAVTDNLGNAGQEYTMGYDQLNQLLSWTTGGGTSCQFAIDQYGNLSLSSGNDCAMISGLSFNASNQIVGYVYDASGNLLSDTSGSNYTWNGNSQLVGFAAQGAGGSYVYDGLLRRVEKTADGVTTVYARDALGDVVASLTNGVWTDYIWADPAAAGDHISATPAAPAAERIAAVVGSGVGTVYYFHADQVGTTRVVTNQAGANVAACGQSPTYPNGSFLTYGPFGMPQGCVQSATPILFTGHELDSESNLSQFQYRKYAALEARWATPDPAGINGPAAPSPDAFDLGPAAAGSPFDLAPESPTASLATLPGFGLANGAVCVHRPQEWNGYSYVGSQPAGARDPTGMFWVRGLPSWRCYGACLGLAQITVYRICRFVVGYWGECAAGVEAAFALLCWERCS